MIHRPTADLDQQAPGETRAARRRALVAAGLAVVMLMPAGAAAATRSQPSAADVPVPAAASGHGPAGHGTHGHGASLTAAPASERYDYRNELAQVKTATTPYRNRATAMADGYVEFLECFESAEGGMGQHYVNLDLLDGEVDPLRPEAMVYEVDGRRHELVAVEWIVPGDGSETPPRLFAQDFHYNGALEVWVLHAWIWKPNPSGVFADWNPRVRRC